MAPVETIPLEKTAALWRDLAADGTTVRLSDPVTGNAWRAVVEDVRARKGRAHLIVADKASLRCALAEKPDTRLTLTFADRNRVPHTCEIADHRLEDGEIWLALPAAVTRQQRRNIFRLAAPPGTELVFTIGGRPYRLLVLNVSIGGALALLTAARSGSERIPPLSAGQAVFDAQLIFAARSGSQRICIAECIIRRLGVHRPSAKIQCAFEFTSLEGAEEQRLTGLIYECQRSYLRRRRHWK